MTTNPVPIAFVGQLPPPFHGQAIANECLLSGQYTQLTLHPIRVDLSDRLSDVGKARFTKVRRLWDTRRRIRRVAEETGAQTVYYSMGFTNLIGAVKDAVLLAECRKRFRHVVVHLHTGSMSMVLGKYGVLARQTFGRIFSSVDAWILLSPELNQFDDVFHPRHVFHLANGVEVPLELGGNVVTVPGREIKDVPTILFMSNLFESKGTDVLLQAAGVLRRRNVPFLIKFVGSWPSQDRRRELESLVQSEGLEQHVQLIGPLVGADKWREMKEADIFCLPTHFNGEAMPLSIIEALACGVPVVSTIWRAIPDLVQDGVHGFLIPCRDVSALADRLHILLDDAHLRVTLGNNARRAFVARHTTRQFQAGFERILLEITSHTRRAPSAPDISLVGAGPR